MYLDLVVVLNFCVDFLLLLGTNRLSGYPSNMRSLLLASLLGAAYAGWCMIPGFRFLGNFLWRSIFLAGIALIAFGWSRSTVKRCCVFVLLSMALGGIALSMGNSNVPALVLAAGGTWLLCRLSFGTAVGEREFVPIQITHRGKTVNIVALRDSGNTLRDPISGEQVLVVSGDVAERLLGLTGQQLSSPLETLALGPVSGLRLIPYCAVGQGSSMLLAMRMDHVKVGSQERSTIVAFAPEGLGKGMEYQALTGGAI